MLIEDISFYNAEGTILRKVQQRLLEILIAVDKVCRDNNIYYWMDCGTLLGAVRHHGFIPWDDDIDISVKREDYKRLREALIRELPSQFVFQDSQTDKYAFSIYGRVRDTKSYCYMDDFRFFKEQGLWIDIFIVDPIPSFRYGHFTDFFYRRSHHEIHYLGIAKNYSKMKLFTIRSIAFLMYPFSIFLVKFGRLLAKIRKSDCLVKYSDLPKNWQASWIGTPIEIEFEGHLFFAPQNYDAQLKINYGDYMKIPPKEKRKHTLNLDTVKFFD